MSVAAEHADTADQFGPCWYTLLALALAMIGSVRRTQDPSCLHASTMHAFSMHGNLDWHFASHLAFGLVES